ncbi:uncharacterized protein BDZ99DRAFT_525536 [Mytilinidion resinicola]|uniref:Uncharacterized protein n=1 Tax=Mytilinidion resinicola TaxID=574789 RepID=A0A6A6Y7B9_9PEZI|nr:uncharacterized protein BDZ99DRAFT_525536 [Mytilinidion resinicola]KAF2804712.1 hypothetical protein BDZ99DRAFT_525536 [Mytilinidion resinicola]
MGIGQIEGRGMDEVYSARNSIHRGEVPKSPVATASPARDRLQRLSHAAGPPSSFHPNFLTPRHRWGPPTLDLFVQPLTMAMHHPSTALTPSSLISLRLVKFSNAVDPSSEAEKFSWKHTTQDLVVVFDSFRNDPLNHAGHPTKMMKVIQGTKVLESVDIEGKIREANNVIDTFRQLNVEIRHDQLPISGLVRCPLLALRYTLADSKIRRLQLKFASESDFKIVYDFLTGMGCQITQSLPGSSTAPPTAITSAESIGPSGRPSSLAHLTSAPEATSSRGIGSSGMPFSSLQPSNSQVQQDAAAGCQRPPTARLDSISESAYLASPSQLLQRNWTPSFASVPPSDNLDVLKDLRQRYVSIQASPAYSSPGPRDTNQIASAVRTHFPHLNTIAEHEAPTSTSRPFTAPESQMDSLLQMIPPRRELPFRRDGSQAGSSRPSSSIDLPPLPRPSFSERNRNATEPSQVPKQASDRPSASASASGNTRQAPPSAASSIDRVVAQISAEVTSSSGSTHNLASYATQAVDDRETVISDWMMQHIEDDGFMTLCEDVLGCWRRIGLGL